MKNTDHIANHDQYSRSYDSQVNEYHSHAHDVLFGMCYKYVKTGENLLDLGIGTGLSSVHFAKIGLEITGLDGSNEMLKECEKKKFAKELKKFNIQEIPFPYQDESFSYVICCGVFHFFDLILPIFKDVQRVLKTGGIFAFTIASPTIEEKKSFFDQIPDNINSPTAWGIPIFKHTDEYIYRISDELGFSILKEQKLLVKGGKDESDDILFKAIVMRKEI
jgi:ubiquinone/menaquinone biosynthesis C-methylase UbiE